MRNPITDCLTPRAMQASVRAAWAVLGTHAALLPSSAVKPSRDGITAYACWPERAALGLSGRLFPSASRDARSVPAALPAVSSRTNSSRRLCQRIAGAFPWRV